MKKTLIALLLVGSSSALFAQAVTGNTTPDNTTTNSTNQTTTTDNGTNTNVNTTNTNSDVNTTGTDVNTTANDNTTSTSVSTGNYNAYGTVAVDVPTTVRYSFQKDYPTVTNANWYLTPNGQYRVIYKDNMNQDMDVYYYGTSAQSYMVSLPVRQSLTPEDVISKAKSMYGLNVYDIKTVKAANMANVYHVRLLENGQVRDVWLSEQGSEVAAADVFRTADVANNDVINEVNTATSSDANAAMSNSTSTDASTDANKDSDTKVKMKFSDGTKIKAKDGEIKAK